MKKLLLSFWILIMLVSIGIGQTNIYHAFPESCIWRVDYDYYNPFQYPCHAGYYFQYYASGDTLINSSIHKKIYRSIVQVDTLFCTYPEVPPNAPAAGYVGALKDDSVANKAFFVFPNSNTDSLLYDYNLMVGDTMKGFIAQSIAPNPAIVLSVDSIIINGEYRKKWNFSEVGNGIFPFIIEGIGSSVGLIEPVYTYYFDFKTRYLVCVKDSSATYFTSDYNSLIGCNLIINKTSEFSMLNTISISPNPFSNETTLKTGQYLENGTLTISNSFGRIVGQINNIKSNKIILHRDNLPSGLYFLRLTQENINIASGKLVITD